MTSYPDLWNEPRQDGRDRAVPGHTGTIRAMTVLEPAPEDDVLALQPVVRSFLTANFREVIDRLKPQVDGSYGPVNPRLLELYLQANRDLGKLYRVYDPPKKKQDDGPGDDVAAAALRERIVAELAQIRAQVTGSDPR